MKKTIIKIVAEYIGCDEETILSLARRAGVSYKIYDIPKRTGGKRRIFHPSRETKALQYALLSTVLKTCKVHECATAYKRGVKSPTLRNAKEHSVFSYTIRIDFKDFFPSIKPDDLFEILKMNELSDEEKEFLKKSLFLFYKGAYILTIGAPTSPQISNAVMFKIDEQIKNIAINIDTKSKYTRYADDIFFSTNKKGLCASFYSKVESLIENTALPDLKINKQKTVYLSKKNKRSITGLVVCPNGKISIGRDKKRQIKSLMNEYKWNTLTPKDRSVLKGYFAYIKDVEPDFINRIIHKYGSKLFDSLIKE